MKKPARCIALILACFCLAMPAGAQTNKIPAAEQSDSDDVDLKDQYNPADLLLPSGPRVLLDVKSGQVLSENRSGETWYPASLTKLMTAYVVFSKLRSGALKLDQQIPVSDLAHSQQPSKIGVPAGKTVSVDFALQALLVYSANDMAYVLAEAASGSHRAFAADMNAAARTLGMNASHFVNPNGLFDPRHVSSARDMAILAYALINGFPEHQHYFSMPHVVVGKRKLANRNSLIRIMPDADGMKTGFVCNSGFNLAASATRDGRRLVAIVLGAESGQARARIARAMLEEGFRQSPGLSSRKISDLGNMPQGAIVPADMTTAVCKKKAPVQVVEREDVAGWGVSFGTYDTMIKADMALRGRLLDRAGIESTASPGVLPLPEKAGFMGALWNLQQGESLQLCTAYRADGAYCDVLPPDVMEQIAAELPQRKPPKSDDAQGSEEGRKPDAATEDVPANGKPAKAAAP